MLDLKAGEHRTQDTPPQLIAPEREVEEERKELPRNEKEDGLADDAEADDDAVHRLD